LQPSIVPHPHRSRLCYRLQYWHRGQSLWCPW